MQVFIGADHRGFSLKQHLLSWLPTQGYSVVDCGNAVYDHDDDFPDFAFAVADRVIADEGSLGIVICGSAGGVVIAANKVRGIRAVMGNTVDDVVHNRKHNDINVMALASDFTTEHEAEILVTSYLTTPYEPQERFIRRLQKIEARENI